MKIPGYEIEGKLGQGGMAVVYLAVQESLQRPVALKVLNPLFSDDPQFSERFLREGRIVASLTHNNIITIHDIGIAEDFHFISMEYLDGLDLKGRMKAGLTLPQAVAHTRTICQALSFAHSRRFVHRDVKPANILFRDDDTLLLSDFGIAKNLDGSSDITVTGTPMGSPHYLSPEQAQGLEVERSHRYLQYRDHPLRDVGRGEALQRGDRGGHHGPAITKPRPPSARGTDRVSIAVRQNDRQVSRRSAVRHERGFTDPGSDSTGSLG